jgi:Holliday junction resolvase RusA-like endonuclease
MTPLFECTIDGRPVVKKNTKKFSSKGGVYYSPQFKAWEVKAILQVRKEMKRFPAERFPFRESVEIHLDFHFKNHQWEGDVSNYTEGPQDLLQKCGVILNDKLIYKILAEKIFSGEEKTIIKLFDFYKGDN